MAKIFVSYCHKQGEWVCDRLLPALKAGGAEVLTDRERFEAGRSIVGQMDSVQDSADTHLLVLSAEYLESDYCRHEMQRAIDADLDYPSGSVIAVQVADCDVPSPIRESLYLDLRDDRQVEPWDQLLHGCDVDLGVDATRWLDVRDELRRDFELDRSVNLVVSGNDVAWRSLIDDLAENPKTRMTRVDLYNARTIERPKLLECMLSENEGAFNLPPAPRDLGEFQRVLESRSGTSRVALMHFDQAMNRDYGIDFFTTLRFLVMEERKLALLVQSHVPFEALLPAEHQPLLSSMSFTTYEVRLAQRDST